MAEDKEGLWVSTSLLGSGIFGKLLRGDNNVDTEFDRRYGDRRDIAGDIDSSRRGGTMGGRLLVSLFFMGDV